MRLLRRATCHRSAGVACPRETAMMDLPAVIVAVGTVGGTWALVGVTWRLVKRQDSIVDGQLSIAKQQLKIQLYLELRKEFDGTLIPVRKLLARQLLDGASHDEINEAVHNCFEDMGMLARRDYVDREMIWDSFGYYVLRWWSALKSYIAKERADKGNDTLFRDFEDLMEIIYQDEIKERHRIRTEFEPSSLECDGFLEEESRL